jgi:omega-amidase
MKKIALAQMRIDYQNAENNISTARDMLDLAVNKHCDCIIFPELWSTGFRLENHQVFSIINRSLLEELQLFSDGNDLEIFGSYLIQRDKRYFNEFVALCPHSKPFSYDKINLFPTLLEPVYLQPGDTTRLFESKLGCCGASICFDLRFPWIYKELAQKGAQFLIIPAHWPIARIHHWDILIQARAIETLSFVIAVNSVGKSGNIAFGGHSSVISPDGDIIFQANSPTEDIFIVEIDPTLIQRVRDKHPFYPNII